MKFGRIIQKAFGLEKKLENLIKSITDNLINSVSARVNVKKRDKVFKHLTNYISENLTHYHLSKSFSNKNGKIVNNFSRCLFRYKNSWFLLNEIKNKEEKKEDSYYAELNKTYEIITYKNNLDILTNLIKNEIYTSNEKENQYITMYSNIVGNFRMTYKEINECPILVYSDEITNTFKNDVQQFIDNKDFYNKTGRVWKRTYLLDGKPGTGKSSIPMLLYQLFPNNIANIRSLTSRDLLKIFDEGASYESYSSKNKIDILVCNDIDRIFNNKTDDTKDPDKIKIGMKEFSIQTLLTFLDTIGSNTIFILTSNDKSKIPPVLVRDGRIDLERSIGNATSIEINKYLNLIYGTDNLVVDDSVELPMSSVEKACFTYIREPNKAVEEINNKYNESKL